MSNREIVVTANAPTAIGPYSQAVKANGFVFTAGVIPLDPATKQVAEGDMRVQADRVLTSLGALLRDAGSSLERTVKTTCFLANFDDFPVFNEIYAAHFTGAETPARSTVQVARLPLGVLVEVECIALLDDH